MIFFSVSIFLIIVYSDLSLRKMVHFPHPWTNCYAKYVKIRLCSTYVNCISKFGGKHCEKILSHLAFMRSKTN